VTITKANVANKTTPITAGATRPRYTPRHARPSVCSSLSLLIKRENNTKNDTQIYNIAI